MLRRLVFSGLLLGVTFCADPVARAQTEGLLLHLPLDECSGDTTAGTEGPEAMVVNSPQWVDGKTGCALEFDGTSNWVEVPVDPLDDPFSPQSPENQGEITICAWVNVLAVGTDTHGQGRQPIVMKGNSNEWEYALYVYDNFGAGMSIWNCGGTGVSEPSAAGTLPQDEWHHVCGTFDVTNGVTVYVDAVQVAQQPPNGNQPCDGTRPVFIAHREDGQFLRAVIDEVAVWERVLDEEEILAVMEGALTEEPNKVTVFIKRDIPDTLINGTSAVVTLTVTPRVGSGVVVINEKLPAGLTPSNPSHNGVVAGDTITWNLGKVDTEVVVSYTMTAALDAANAKILSTATVDGAVTRIGGDTAYSGSPFTSNGFIKLWNHLGPLAWQHPARAGDHGSTGAPGACSALDADLVSQLDRDWIVNDDGTVNEKTIDPFPGLITRPKYGGDGVVPGGTGARAAGLAVAAGDTGLVVRDRFPVWKGSLTRSDTIDHASKEVHGFDAEDHLTMSCTYVTNNTGAPIDTSLGIGSDDSIQIFLNDVDVTAQNPLSVCRGWGGANEEQDILPVTLPVGESRLLVKVTDGCCGSGFRLRFQKDPLDPTAGGLTSPEITVSLESKVTPRPGEVVRSLSKGSIGLGETVDVTLNVSLKTASNVLVREVLPDHTQASAISDGGALTGNTIEWNLAQVTQKTLSYKLAVGPCAGDLTYGQSTFKIGSAEVVVGGTSTVSRTYRQDALGAAWKSADIGAAAGGSRERLGEHEVLVNASGAGVRLLKDEFHFASVAQTGDFEVSARIGCFDDPGGRGIAGLMVRDSLDEGAANAFFGLSSTPPTGGGLGTLKVSFRQDLQKSTSQVTTIAAADKDVAQLPIYLKLVRSGGKLSFQRSNDGTSYREILAKNVPADTRPVNLKPEVLVGLAVTGGGGGSTRANFQAVSGPPFVSVVVAGFRRGDTDGSGTLDLTDAIGVLGRLFLGADEPACLDAADADDSGALDLTDAIYSLGWQFTGGPAPPAPGPTACGPDPTADNFKACVYPGC